jgi:hypothetical protein
MGMFKLRREQRKKASLFVTEGFIMSSNNVVSFGNSKTNTVPQELNDYELNKSSLLDFLTQITKSIANNEIGHIVAIAYNTLTDDSDIYIAGGYKLNELIGNIELLKQSILDDE